MENLREAFYKAQRGKGTRPEVIDFRAHLEQELMRMRSDLLNDEMEIGNYHYFTIYDPKERVICAAGFRERVLHHAIMNQCDKVFERYQIFDSYASRKGKGVDGCLRRAQEYCGKNEWYLKLDIHKFFDSVNHTVLMKLLYRRFKDVRLLKLFSKIINSYHVSDGCGIPIGNLSSQYFANLYLAPLDHLIKDSWRIPGYVRYMDDFLLFHSQKDVLKEYLGKIKKYLEDALMLKLNPPLLNRCRKGIPFLSYVALPNKLRLTQKARHRFRRKIRYADQEENQESALALLAFVNRADAYAFRKKVFS